MAHRPHTAAFYDALLRAFRETPGDFTEAAKAAACDRRTARVAWEFGWRETQWAKPIKDLLDEEKIAARAELATATAAGYVPTSDREKARQDAIQTRAETARVIRSTRGNALGVMALTSKVLAGCVPLADQVRRQLEMLKENGEVDIKTVLNIVKVGAYITSVAGNAAKLAQEMERIELGVAEGDAAGPVSDMPSGLHELTLDEVELRLQAAQIALADAKAAGSDVRIPDPTPPTAGEA